MAEQSQQNLMPTRAQILFLVLTALATHLGAGTYTVTTTADAGAGSFREAIEALNGGRCATPCTIDFALPAPVPASGYFSILPQSPLPLLFGDLVTIDGTSQTRRTGDTNPHGPEIELDGSAAGFRSGIKLGRIVGMTIRGLVVHSFEGHGMVIENSSGVTIADCYIGVDPTGLEARPNGFDGILLRDVYGNTRILGNLIAGNRGNGIYMISANGVDMAGNRIGSGSDLTPLGNGANGVDIAGSWNVGIYANLIANNRDFGITIADGSRTIRMTGNSFYRNGLHSIDLGHDGLDAADEGDADEGANGRMNAPRILEVRSEMALFNPYTSVVMLRGEIRSKPASEIFIDGYAAPHRTPLRSAESKIHLGQTRVTTNAHGHAEFELQSPLEDRSVPAGWVSVTATSMEGTSELSEPVAVMTSRFEVTGVADGGAGSLRDALSGAQASGCLELCWITFNIPHHLLTEGVAVFEPRSPLPPVSGNVYVDGASQAWFQSDTNGARPDVEIDGSHAGNAAGLQIGTPDKPVAAAVLHDLAVRNFEREGIVVHLAGAPAHARVLIRDVILNGHGTDGIALIAAPETSTNTSAIVFESVIGGNAGSGVRVDAANVTITRSMIGTNADGASYANLGPGVSIGARGHHAVLESSVIAFNGGAGVATSPTAHTIAIDSLFHSNSGLGIDRNNDGVDAGLVTSSPARPVITSARFDAVRNVTVVEGHVVEPARSTPPAPPRIVRLTFFHNAETDPTGFGEGEQYVVHPFASDFTIVDGRFTARLAADVRGRFITATATYMTCYGLDGCWERDTSEFSNAILVQ